MKRVPADLLKDCVAAAMELLELLREEEKALLDFQGERLLAILPRKELLAGELDTMLQTLQSQKMLRSDPADVRPQVDERMAGKTAFPGGGLDAMLSVLKGHLAEITALNRRNQIFIECSLSYWDEMLGLFVPTSYGGGMKGRWEPRGFGAKGFAINREV